MVLLLQQVLHGHRLSPVVGIMGGKKICLKDDIPPTPVADSEGSLLLLAPSIELFFFIELLAKILSDAWKLWKCELM